MSKRDFQDRLDAAKAQRDREQQEQVVRAMRASAPAPAARANGSPGGHPPVPFSVMSEAAIVVPPLTKLVWERYFALVDAHWWPGMSKVEREAFASEAMAMAITSLARLGLTIADVVPPGFGGESQAEQAETQSDEQPQGEEQQSPAEEAAP